MTITRYQHCQLDDAPKVNTYYADRIRAIKLSLQSRTPNKACIFDGTLSTVELPNW